MLDRFKNTLLIASPLILFLGFWEWFVYGDRKLQFLFASPSLVVQKAFEAYLSYDIWYDIGVTTLEVVLGLIIGGLLGIVLGLFMWGNGRFERIAKPYIIALGAIPIFAIAPMLIIWFGIGLLSKVIMAGFGVFLVTVIQSYEGAKSTADKHLFFAKSLGAQHWDIIKKIIIPGSLHWVITGIKMSIGFAILGAFIGEFVNAEAGLGHYILKAGSLYDMPKVIFGIINLSLLAFALDITVTFIFSKIFKKNMCSVISF